MPKFKVNNHFFTVICFLSVILYSFINVKDIKAKESSDDLVQIISSELIYDKSFTELGYEFIPQFILENPKVICYSPLSEWKTATRCEKEPEFIGQSRSLSLTDGVGFNALQAINANNGSLRLVEIYPGHEWSFNASVGDPRNISYLKTVFGVYGGGWCDLASRYVQAVRPLLPEPDIRFVNHNVSVGFGLVDVDYHDAVSIWNTGGLHGNIGQAKDLVLWNGSNYGIRLWVVEDGKTLIVRSTWFDPRTMEGKNVY